MWLDYVLLFCLLVLLGAAIFRAYFWLRVVALGGLLLTGVFFEMSLDTIARGVISRRHREGRWTREYSDGVYEMEKATRIYRPYRLIAVTGLAFLAFRSLRKEHAKKAAALSQENSTRQP